MNAKQLIEALSKLDPETLIYWADWDLEYDIFSTSLVSGVEESGELMADFRFEHPDHDRIEKEARDSG